ncbi:MAG: hypothetical protein Kow0069_02940 [Promethearchaeota archaeon]
MTLFVVLAQSLGILGAKFLNFEAASAPPVPPGADEPLVKTAAAAGDVLITEVMPDPVFSETYTEYVELYNPLDVAVDVSNWEIRHQRNWPTADATIPASTVIPPGGYLLVWDNSDWCRDNYSVSGIANHSEAISLLNTDDDVVLVDDTGLVIDRVAWQTGFSNTLDSFSWFGGGVPLGSEGKALARLYDPDAGFAYVDTNTSADWVYDVDHSIGLHTNATYQVVSSGDVLITEVMVDPQFSETYTEYVEIYNTLDYEVMVGGWTLRHQSGASWGSADATLPGGTTIPAGGYLLIWDNGTWCADNYTITWPVANHSESITLTNGEADVALINQGGVVLDRVAWQATGTFTSTVPGNSWVGEGVSKGPEGRAISRLYDPGAGDAYVDTNTSADWREDTAPSIGNHTRLSVYVPPPRVLISEVHYGGSTGEWIEIVNNATWPVYAGDLQLRLYQSLDNINLPDGLVLQPGQTYVVGDPGTGADYVDVIYLADYGDVVTLKNGTVEHDAVVWGSGDQAYAAGQGSGWSAGANATGDLPAGQSIFRYNLTRTQLADTNSSADWYVTDDPTPGGFYQIKRGDVLLSEVGVSTSPEFVELYNNLSWPVTLDGMNLTDYGAGSAEVVFSGPVVAPPKSAFVAGPNSTWDYQVPLSAAFTNDGEDLVLYAAGNEGFELDVLLYGDGDSNRAYPCGPASGWVTCDNVTGSFDDGSTTPQRFAAAAGGLVDTNSSSDWFAGALTPGTVPAYVPPVEPASPGDVLITEVMADPDGDEDLLEYVELYNAKSQPVHVGGWTLRHQSGSTWGSADATLPVGLIIPAGGYLMVWDDSAACAAAYGLSGQLNHSEAITLSNGASDVALLDAVGTVVDRVAWRTNTENFTVAADPGSWLDSGVKVGSEGKAITRLYDPYAGNAYVDTNTSADWRYNVPPSAGAHTDTVWFLSSPFTGAARVVTFSSPDNSFAALSSFINSSTSTLDVCVYQFTSGYLLDAVVAAMDRGVQVRLILEDVYPLYDSPYKIHSTHDDENYEVVYVAATVDAHPNGQVRWESAEYFAYTHAKYLIVDGETVVISTENFKPTGIPMDPSAGNRGWGIGITNAQLASKYQKVFDFDWSVAQPFNLSEVVYDPTRENREVLTGDYQPYGNFSTFDVTADFQTVIGPDETIDVIVGLLDSATSCIYVEDFYLYPTWTGYPGGTNNNPFLLALIDAAARHVDVKVILDSTSYNIEGDNNNDEAAQVLRAHGIEVKFSDNSGGIEKFHVKALIVDNESVMISSLNWNENSATNNREVGVIVTSTQVASYYVGLFWYDWTGVSANEPTTGEGEGGTPDESGEDLNPWDDLPIARTTNWKVWLPAALVAYVALLAAGYVARRTRTAVKRRREFVEDLERAPPPGEGVESIPLDVSSIRSRVATFYGDAVCVCHVGSRGEPLDGPAPSDFLRRYVQVNHAKVPVGYSSPIPRVFLIKYDAEHYVAIESVEPTLDLRPKIVVGGVQQELLDNARETERLQAELEALEGEEVVETAYELVAEKEKEIAALKAQIAKLSKEREKLQAEFDRIDEEQKSPLNELVQELLKKIDRQKRQIEALRKGPGEGGDA